ncbi:hypothetical protein L1887_37522 [Cichorium endivia]|nr:hypothetical protein L1887_37522 [Cichorium endivia]
MKITDKEGYWGSFDHLTITTVPAITTTPAEIYVCEKFLLMKGHVAMEINTGRPPNPIDFTFCFLSSFPLCFSLSTYIYKYSHFYGPTALSISLSKTF